MIVINACYVEARTGTITFQIYIFIITCVDGRGCGSVLFPSSHKPVELQMKGK